MQHSCVVVTAAVVQHRIGILTGETAWPRRSTCGGPDAGLELHRSQTVVDNPRIRNNRQLDCKCQMFLVGRISVYQIWITTKGYLQFLPCVNDYLYIYMYIIYMYVYIYISVCVCAQKYTYHNWRDHHPQMGWSLRISGTITTAIELYGRVSPLHKVPSSEHPLDTCHIFEGGNGKY